MKEHERWLEGIERLGAGELQDAQRFLADLDPKTLAAEQCLQLAERLESLQRLELAAVLLEAALQAHGRVPGLWLGLARLRQALGEPEAAMRAAEEAVRLEGESLELWLFLAEIQTEAGRANLAPQSLRMALSLDEADWRPWFALGRLEEAQEQSRIAIAHYRHAVRLEPPAAEPYLALARLLGRRLGGDDGEEIEGLKAAAASCGLSQTQIEAYLARE